MKNIFKIIVLVCISLGLLNAESIEQNGQKDGYEIKVSSEKTLIVGNNDIFIELSKDTKQINEKFIQNICSIINYSWFFKCPSFGAKRRKKWL